MALDATNVLLVTAIMSATVGGLLIWTSMWSENQIPLRAWGCANLVGAASVWLLLVRGVNASTWSMILPMGLLSCSYAVSWAATRSFTGRPAFVAGFVIGPVVWCSACAIPAVAQSTFLRVLVISGVIAAYTLASAYELWRDRRETLLSRYPLLACLVVHAGFVALRIPLSLSLPNGDQMLSPAWVGIMAIEPAILFIAVAFLQLSMAMERVEGEQRRAAMTDALTGVASRRAFLEQGEARLAAARRTSQPAALLMFDLDHFKAINDRFGHETGDDVLRAFAEAIRPIAGKNALFGRLGGEEFAFVLTGAAAETPLMVAEACRAATERLVVGPEGSQPAISVSIGVAASRGTCALGDLLRGADRALYAAKSHGRNAVRLHPSTPAVLARAA